MTLELFLFPPSPRAFKVIAAAHYLGLSYETRIVQLFKGEQDHPDYVALNPNKRMPVLKEDEFVLWESNAITQYLALKNPAAGLLPDNARQLAHVNQWQCWELAHWLPAVAVLIEENVKKARRGEQPNLEELHKGERLFHTCAGLLDKHLKGQNFVACGRLTVADFSVGSWLEGAERAKYPMEPYLEIKRWHQSLGALPCWQYARAQSETFLQAMEARRGQ
jgi:glutathione S-transferase